MKGRGMRTIHKYKLEIDDTQIIKTPKDAHFIYAAVQRNEIYVWARVDTATEDVHRKILIFGTGHLMPEDIDDLDYIGSVQMAGGSLVWHIYEGEKDEM
jgi:hypothetical protein